MKITDLNVWVTKPEPQGRSYVFIRIDTDEGISGIGEATSSGGGGSIVVGSIVKFLRDTTVTTDFRESLLGEDPAYIDRIWHKLFRRFTGGGGYGGFVTTVLSGIDIALWDIKGKVEGKPVYQLFGGPVWDNIQLYSHVNPREPKAAAEHAKQLVKEGYTALKLDPFSTEMSQHHRRYMRGMISAAGAANAIELLAAVREAVGPDVEVLIDCHGNFNVPTAINLAKRMEPYNIGWMEEPVQPDSNEALRHVKENVSVPICVGERLYSRFDFVPVLKDGLAEYLMPDILWCGGISEMRKIANLAEAFYVPVSPHDASGPINILAGGHTMMTVPNFYKLEINSSRAALLNSFINTNLDIRNGYLHLPEKPGLGAELDIEFIEAHPDPDWK